jgi:nicotinamidase-related amidase/type 1 glutamine amidotransferase
MGAASLHWAMVCLSLLGGADSAEGPLVLHARQRIAVPGSERYELVERSSSWDPRKTAIVVCDMWDQHWCRGATARVAEMAPRMNEVLKAARRRGVLILHCPSDTMDFYQSYPQRKRAQAAPAAALVERPAGWCKLRAEGEPPLPFDNPHDRCDCQPQCPHGNPWRRQVAALEIAPEDAITDSLEALGLMRARGIENVIVMGVHTNMCVLGRPFAIRSLCAQGQNVVLMRDLTDSMHDSGQPPVGLDHFRATELVVAHIEKYWCPTITSTDFLGGAPFSFAGDKRPHVVLLIGEDEYQTERTLPEFGESDLADRGLRLSYVFADPSDKNSFPAIGTLDAADLLLVSVRRRFPPREQLDSVRAFVAAGKPVVGIRTASHAFAEREGYLAPPGHGVWQDFDGQVLGGNYTGHHGDSPPGQARAYVQVVPEAADHPILRGLPRGERPSSAWLYKTSPLAQGTTLLMTGRAPGGAPPEPVAWTHQTPAGGRVFYTSLGHVDDFGDPAFRQLLAQGVRWALRQ